MKTVFKKLLRKAGLPPGTLLASRKKKPSETHVDYISYSTEQVNLQPLNLNEPFSKLIKANEKNWFDFRMESNIPLLQKIGTDFGVHSLILEDVTNTLQLPKIEYGDNWIFISLKLFLFKNNKLVFEHICIYFKDNIVLSFQEPHFDQFEAIKTRINQKKGKICEKDADYLVYALIDYCIDSYFVTLKYIDDQLNDLQELVDLAQKQDILKDIHQLKRQLSVLRRHFWYTRDIILSLKKEEHPLIDSATEKYINDLYDHIQHVIDISESFRDDLNDLTERHLAAINLRSNEIMKFLTILSALFLPLSFLAGFYGMNFKYMPELEFKYAYPILAGTMLIIAVVLLLLFRKKGWFK